MVPEIFSIPVVTEPVEVIPAVVPVVAVEPTDSVVIVAVVSGVPNYEDQEISYYYFLW